ncbi:H-NS family nucleoid-associated regulatory protein [Roseateles sp. MS654]|uniref:H-NS family nucleoid-associated regulatory protein n=1 Tax=Roseateles sp. MS654 TaxID=3412685 RepID=UPI003C2D6E14
MNLLFLIGLFLSAWAAFSDFSCLLGGGAYDTWSGRGRAPKWLVDLETQGRGREEFRAV